MKPAKLQPEARLSSLEKQVLRGKLDQYYDKVVDYLAFSEISDQVSCWDHIGSEIEKLKRNNERNIDVLEIGAGRSGFGQWLELRGIRDQVHWSAQDVTHQNSTWLESQANQVIYSDVSEISANETFDIVFSTYVLEHVTNPASHLEYLYNLLRPEGSLFIFCPRYDMPGYLCPSSKHLSLLTRIKFELQWIKARCNSWLKHSPAFLIQTDLAAFHKPFFIDADAVHWVSYMDLKYWADSKGAQTQQLNYGTPRIGTKDWIVKRWLTCSVKISKT